MPVVLVLVLFAAGSWPLLRLLTLVSQGFLLPKIKRLEAPCMALDPGLPYSAGRP